MRVGVLAFQGDVAEHILATKSAAAKLKIKLDIIEVRTLADLDALDCIIIPGGESTTLQKLCERAGIFEEMKRIKNLFGTCAGAIMLAKEIHDIEEGQRSLGLMDISVDRNAYGRQIDSFEKDIKTELGDVHAIFIRAPKITSIGESVHVLAESDGGIIACEQRSGGRYMLALCFHPELTTTVFHERFLKESIK